MSINSGLVIVNKPQGISSYDVIRALKKQLGTKKIGHSGTLDPLATGVLVVGVERGTKYLNLLDHDCKTYQTHVKVGVSTNTFDSEGEVVETRNDVVPEASVIMQVFGQMVGQMEQTPPKYSAKKINGVSAYKLARQGVEFELKPQLITIHSLELIAVDETGFSFETTVSHGTYIRSLVQDILDKLGIIGCMDQLIRTINNGFSLSEAKTLDTITKDDIIGLDSLLKSTYPSYTTSDNIIINGGKKLKKDYQLPCIFINEKNNQVIGIYDQYDCDYMKPVFMC